MQFQLRMTTAMLLLVSLVMLMPAAALGADQPEFEMKTSYSGNEVKVIISAHRLNDLYAYHLFLSHDAGKVKLKQAKSSIAGFSVTPETDEGRIEIAFTRIGPVDGLSGSAELAELTLELAAPGVSPLVLETAELVNSAIEKTVLKPALSQPLVHFGDMAGHWAQGAVYSAAAAGYVNGYDDGMFRPDRNVTRAEFAVMLARAYGLEPGGQTAFADAAAIPDWAAGYVAAAVQAGWISGYADRTFRPERLITREEMAVIAARAGQLELTAGSKTGFGDDAAIGPWAKAAVAAAQERGILSGMGDGTFKPQGHATRAQAVTVIAKLMS